MTSLDIAIHDFGGDGPDLLLAHATGFHGLVWEPVVDHLQEHFRCVAFDERGHGLSDKAPGDDYTWEGFAEDALAVVDGLGLGGDGPLFGVGHSAGGAALLMAERDRPGTFAGLWLYEPIVFPPLGERTVKSGGNSLAEGSRRRREVFESRDAAYERYASKPPLDRLDPVALRAYVEHGFEDLDDGTVRLRCRREDEARIFEMGDQHGAWAALPELAVPAVVAGGTGGAPAELAPRIADRLPSARYEHHAELGHFGPLEAPERIAAAIATALAPPRT